MQVREILVVGSSLLLIAKDLVGGSDDLYLLARRRLTAVKIGMVLLDRRAERPREGLNVCAGVGAQQIGERLLRCAAGPGVPTTDPVTLAELQAHSRRRPWRTGRDPARGSVTHRPASSRQPPGREACGGWSRP